MRKTLLAFSICVVMISAMAVTNVSAKPMGQSNVHRYDITAISAQGNSLVIGQLTVNLNTGHYHVILNIDKWPAGTFDYTGKEFAGKDGFLGAYNSSGSPTTTIACIHSEDGDLLMHFNQAGIAYGAGIITAIDSFPPNDPIDVLAWLNSYGDGASWGFMVTPL